MDNRFKNILPLNLQYLVDEIENYSGVEIQVLENHTPIYKEDLNPNILACEINEKSMAILYRNIEDFKPEGVAHELLHLKRYANEQIPTFYPKKIENIRIVAEIDNILEHLIIIPQEVGLVDGYDVFSYWNWVISQTMQLYYGLTDDWKKRKICLMGWLYATFIVTDQEVKNMVEQCLIDAHLRVDANLFVDKIRKNINSKQKMISTVCRFLNIPNTEVDLLVFDIKNKKRIITELPII